MGLVFRFPLPNLGNPASQKFLNLRSDAEALNDFPESKAFLGFLPSSGMSQEHVSAHVQPCPSKLRTSPELLQKSGRVGVFL